MCTRPTVQDFITIHHELGHIQYYQQYAHQPIIFRNGANSAFHEAVGDTLSLSAWNSNILRQVFKLGLLVVALKLIQRILKNIRNALKTLISDQETDLKSLNRLMKIALAKIPFLAYSLSLEKFRWKIFRSGFNDQVGFHFVALF